MVIKVTDLFLPSAFITFHSYRNDIYEFVFPPSTLVVLGMEYDFSVEGVNATPYEDNMRYFNVAIAGPIGTPYEGTCECFPTVAMRL